MRCQCLICADWLGGSLACVSLVCGHIFHESCLDEWRRKTEKPNCPVCRRALKTKEIRKIYLSSFEDSIRVDPDDQSVNHLAESAASAELRKTVESLEKKKSTLETSLAQEKRNSSAYKKKLQDYATECERLRVKTGVLQVSLQENEILKDAVKTLKRDLAKTNFVRYIVREDDEEVGAILAKCGSGENSLQRLAECCVLLKRQLSSARDVERAAINEKQTINNEKIALRNELEKKSQELLNVRKELEDLRDKYRNATTNDDQKASGSRATKRIAEDSFEAFVHSPIDVRQKNGYLQRKLLPAMSKPKKMHFSSLKIVDESKLVSKNNQLTNRF